MDYQRFAAINTSKGPWALLDQLRTARQAPQQEAGSSEQAAELDSRTSRPAMALADVEVVIREVAAGIIGDNLEGN